MSRFVGTLVLILVAGIASTDTVAEEASQASSHLSVTSPKRFEEIDIWTGARFAAQALVAPKTLRSVVPLYTYEINALNRTSPDRLRERQRGFTAIVCQPNSREVYTGYPIVAAKSERPNEQKSQLSYRDIQRLITTDATQQSSAIVAAQHSGQAGGATNFGDWQREHCDQNQNTLLLGTSYPISGVPEGTRLWTKKGYWDSNDTVVSFPVKETVQK